MRTQHYPFDFGATDHHVENRRGEMLLLQNRRVNLETCQIGIPGATTKDKENRRVPFNPEGRRAQAATNARDGRVRVRRGDGAYQRGLEVSWNDKDRPLRLASGG